MLQTLLLDQETIHAAVSRVVHATEEPSVSTSYFLGPHPVLGLGGSSKSPYLIPILYHLRLVCNFILIAIHYSVKSII